MLTRLLSQPVFFALFCGLLFAPYAAKGQGLETQVLVRALSHDAKIIGSNVGGARIVIQDAATGATLAEGLQAGSTGNTRLLVTEPPARGETRYGTEGAAGFLATLMLVRPTVVDITAYAPLGTPHAMQRASKRLLLVPGKDVLGEGILIELNGFTVELLAPTEGIAAAHQALTVRAKVTMLCGCPTEPGGTWDADAIEVVARVLAGDTVLTETTLAFAGTTSEYTGTVTVAEAGVYTLEVLAMDPSKGNFGQVQQSVAFTQ